MRIDRGRFVVGLWMGLALACGAAPVRAQDVPFTLRTGVRLQLRATRVDLETAPTTTTLFTRRARLSFTGNAYEHFDYQMQMEMAGSAVQLIDANVRWAPGAGTTFWFGQGKAWFGRQQLTSSGSLHFVDRSIVDDRFSAKRQQGVAVVVRPAGERVEVNAGVHNGNGINQSVNPDNRFLTVARVVLTPLGAYAPVESAHDYPAEPRVALGVAGLHQDIGRGPGTTELRRANLEGAFKLQGFNATSEAYREWLTPPGAPRLTTDGWYGQAGYLLPGRTHELAGRVALVRTDLPSDSEVLPVDANRTELGVAYSYYLRAHSAKVQADFRNIHDRGPDQNRRELRVQLQIAF